MKLMLALSLAICLPLIIMAQKSRKLFPYNYSMDDLPNGLRLVTVPTDYPNLVALYIVVSTGSRNEVETGKSGYAHLFEHLMFLGSEHYTGQQRDEILKLAGADANAYTSDDRTVYHMLFSKDDLEKIIEIEADRFQRLKYAVDAYKTETSAVLGEFNKNSADPTEKLFEVLRATAYKRHTYTHTTMGFIADIEDMPNQFEYSWEFYKRYYRPEYTTVVIAGDVQRQQALALVRKYFADWKRGEYVPQIPPEPEQTEPREAHVDWPSATLPLVCIAFRGPAYSDEKKDKAALDLLERIAFGENSDLYQKLVLKEQKVDTLDVTFADRVDPELFVVLARVKNSQDTDYVRDQILDTFRRYSRDAVSEDKLASTRSRLRYGFALSLDSSEAIAAALAPYLSLRHTPETVDKLFALYDTITPQDIRGGAAHYFVDKNRTIVTLAPKVTGKEGE